MFIGNVKDCLCSVICISYLTHRHVKRMNQKKYQPLHVINLVSTAFRFAHLVGTHGVNKCCTCVEVMSK